MSLVGRRRRRGRCCGGVLSLKKGRRLEVGRVLVVVGMCFDGSEKRWKLMTES